MSKLVTISVAATALGVSPIALRRREADGRLTPARIESGQRRYDLTALRSDVLGIITVFSGRLCGSRNIKNQKLIDGMCNAVRDAQC